MLSVEWAWQRSHYPVERPRLRPDLVAVGGLAVLVALGLANLRALGATSLADHQAAVVAGGIVLFCVLRRCRTVSLRWLGWVSYGASVFLLLLVVAAGDLGYGARRWLTVGSFTLQPSELAKVGLLLVLARVLGTDRPWYRRLAAALGLAAVPIALVVVEPDLSTATVLAALTLVMLVLGRIPLRAIAALALAAGLVAPLGEHLLRPYQLERLHGFFSGTSSGAGWTILQAHIALAWGGSSGLAGQPFQHLLAEYLPSRETDLAYASLVEQWGIRAGILAVLAAGAVIWRIALCSRHARTRDASLAAAGLAALIGIEVGVSVAANLGLVPTAGVPFPLVSYGGTAIAVHLAAVGMVLALRADAERRELWLVPRWRRTHPRLLRFTALAVTASLVAMVGFAWQLQHKRGPGLRAAGLDQMTRCVTVPATRGVITDRNGVPLAVNTPQDDIWAVRGMASRSALGRLAPLVAQPGSTLRRIVSGSDELIVPVATLPPTAAARVAAAHLPGVLVVPAAHRTYPYGALLGPVLGWTGVATPADMQRWPDLRLGAIVGRAGLEQQYDTILRGVDGRQCVYVDPAGTPVALASYTPPVPGTSLRLTIDLGLQRHVAAALTAAVRQGGSQGAAVVMDPRNGRVLAMASTPSYDDNLFGPPVDEEGLADLNSAPGDPQLEHATQLAAPPGSTFKLVVAAANMAHPTWSPDEVVPTGGAWTLDGHTFHNWGVLPPQNLEQAIAWSNDVYFYKLAWALGADKIVSMARTLGVGQPTGIDLPGETGGYLGTPAALGDQWYPGSTVLLGIGQGYLTTTPLQDARWTAGVSTGALVTPHLGLSFGSGRTPLTWPAPRRLGIDLGPVRAGMRAAVTTGTATVLASLPVAAGGKTGTAEDPSAGGEGLDSWMSAVAPIDSPLVEATAFIRGQGNGHPSSEVVREALAYYFAHAVPR
ncbi:MAG TPA: FtsW/RodA/SpoVE family cell cycle protein [Jatrophihabitantaceae bacterium]|jgi:cell division protein FtsI/penicillin-binding protein 2/cell division protein FtsW (lipid II flippase)